MRGILKIRTSSKSQNVYTVIAYTSKKEEPEISLNFVLRLFAGVPEQAPDLGLRPVAAHWPGHGHREHPALCGLQQTEHNTWRECRMWSTDSTSLLLP